MSKAPLRLTPGARRRCALFVLCFGSGFGCAPPSGSRAPAAALPRSERPIIVQAGEPVLRTRAREVPPERVMTPEIQALIARMIEAMRNAPGVGLAAPQLGVPLRIIVLEDRLELLGKLTPLEVRERERVAFGPRVIINPVVEPAGEEKVGFFEGCLSVDGYAAYVERYRTVTVTGLDERGAPQVWTVRGWPARILQHEIDHLNGTLYVDRMYTRSFSTGEHVKRRFGGRPARDVRRMLGLD